MKKKYTSVADRVIKDFDRLSNDMVNHMASLESCKPPSWATYDNAQARTMQKATEAYKQLLPLYTTPESLGYSGSHLNQISESISQRANQLRDLGVSAALERAGYSESRLNQISESISQRANQLRDLGVSAALERAGYSESRLNQISESISQRASQLRDLGVNAALERVGYSASRLNQISESALQRFSQLEKSFQDYTQSVGKAALEEATARVLGSFDQEYSIRQADILHESLSATHFSEADFSRSFPDASYATHYFTTATSYASTDVSPLAQKVIGDTSLAILGIEKAISDSLARLHGYEYISTTFTQTHAEGTDGLHSHATTFRTEGLSFEDIVPSNESLAQLNRALLEISNKKHLHAKKFLNYCLRKLQPLLSSITEKYLNKIIETFVVQILFYLTITNTIQHNVTTINNNYASPDYTLGCTNEKTPKSVIILYGSKKLSGPIICSVDPSTHVVTTDKSNKNVRVIVKSTGKSGWTKRKYLRKSTKK